MSLAEAILEYIANNIKCKTLFSTHYHELTDMEKTLPNLKNVHVSAIEENGNITFLHKVKDGSVDKSYGINVATLAGLPKEVIDRANIILKEYETKENKKRSSVQIALPLNFEEKKSVVEEELKKIDILNITPIEAINILSKLKEKVKLLSARVRGFNMQSHSNEEKDIEEKSSEIKRLTMELGL